MIRPLLMQNSELLRNSKGYSFLLAQGITVHASLQNEPQNSNTMMVARIVASLMMAGTATAFAFGEC